MDKHYSPDLANSILSRAMQDKPLPGDVSRQRLEEMAQEVGVSPAELDAAEARMNEEASVQETAAQQRKDRLRRAGVWAAAGVLAILLIASGDGPLSGAPPPFFILLIVGFIIWARRGSRMRRSCARRMNFYADDSGFRDRGMPLY